MVAREPITIVGGGLAGLTLGIALRQRGVPVTVFEAGNYPRHRVCGEFVSGVGLATLSRLGLTGKLIAAGARTAATAAFYLGRRATRELRLPEPALCLSRFVLDELLAREFQRLGGGLRPGERWRGEEFGEGIIRATGRRIQTRESGWRWFGLKAHVRNVELLADLELHVVPDGYVGLCRLAGGAVNVCGLFRSREALPESPHRRPEFLGGPAGSPLQCRLANAVWEPSSFCAVAGLSLRPVSAGEREEFCIGDAITLIPPATGNGMSMAFESAELAAPAVAGFSDGATSWREARRKFAADCERAFRRRLICAGRLQRSLLGRGFSPFVLLQSVRVNWIWRRLFAWTR